MTDEELDRLEALANAATAGPWEATQCLDAWVEVGGKGVAQCGDIQWVGSHSVVNDEQQMKANCLFIAASREAIPALIAEIRRLRAAVVEVPVLGKVE